MSPILEVENLVKKFGEHQAVKGVSFEVEEGEVFGLLGPNAAGKTTTISMLTGILTPTSGTARVGGYDILTQSFETKRMIGLVPQDIALYPTLSARANLNFFGNIYGLHSKALESRVDDVLEVVALTDRQKEPIEKFSGGMKRRVNIAAGLVHQPRVLFLDEPTVGVDPQSRNHIFESVLKLNKDRGTTIIYTSHYMEEVELLCNRVAIIDQGQIIALDTIKNLIGMLGGGVIQFGMSEVDDDLLRQMKFIPAVTSVTLVSRVELSGEDQPEGGKSNLVKIEAENSQQAVVNLIGFLGDRKLHITSLEILQPNLESVFLHLTGKNLRE